MKLNKFNDLDNVKIISTGELGTIVDIYKYKDDWYYQVELTKKTKNREVIECKETELEKVEKDTK